MLRLQMSNGKISYYDKTKLNLDGPDNVKFYWRGLCRVLSILFEQQSSGGSAMMWACFLFCDMNWLVLLDKRKASSD